MANRRTPDSLLTFEVTARQDLAWGGFSAFENDRWPDVLRAPVDNPPPGITLDPHQDQGTNLPIRGQWLRGPATLQQLPTVRLDLPRRPLGEHLDWGLSVDFTRLAPFSGHTGDEGIDGLYKINQPGSPPLVTTQVPGCVPGFWCPYQDDSPRATASGSPASARRG